MQLNGGRVADKAVMSLHFNRQARKAARNTKSEIFWFIIIQSFEK